MLTDIFIFASGLSALELIITSFLGIQLFLNAIKLRTKNFLIVGNIVFLFSLIWLFLTLIGIFS